MAEFEALVAFLLEADDSLDSYEGGVGEPAPLFSPHTRHYFQGRSLANELRSQGSALADFTIAELAELYGVDQRVMRLMLHTYRLPFKRLELAQKRNHDWNSIDWSQTNFQIAKQLGVSPSYVWTKRRLLDKPAGPTVHDPSFSRWKQLNWNRTDKEIATEQNVSRQMVSSTRRRYAPDTVDKYHANRKYDWKLVNWDQPNTNIAKELGATLSMTQRMRLQLAPQTVAKWKGMHSDWYNVDWSKRVKDIAAELGTSPQVVANAKQWLRQRGHKTESIVDTLLETDNPFQKKAFTLEYRPYKKGDDWFWFWVLHPEDGKRAIAHGRSDSRAQASIAARLKARQLKGVIAKVNVTGGVTESLWGRSKVPILSKLSNAAWTGALDWKRRDDEIAADYEVSPRYVRSFRRRFIPWKPKRLRRAADNKFWGK